MTLDITKPSDAQNLVSELGYYIRETRIGVNALESALGLAGVIASQTDYICASGQTAIAVGTGISAAPIEFVNISGVGAAVLENLTDGTKGQMKYFYFDDANISFRDSTSLINGTFRLNQVPAGGVFGNYLGNIIAFVNIGGDGGVSQQGFWREIFRTLSVA